MNTEILECDYSDPEHLNAVVRLLNAYIADEMGGGAPLSKRDELHLVDGLNSHPTAIVLLARTGDTFSGMLVAFGNFATFTAKPMINIHDLIVLKEFRTQGIGRRLMNAVIRKAEATGCSRLTLEVRNDNVIAQQLYKELGFGETDPEMYYWRLELKTKN
ncbi:MAG: GNAT family N-acetyltransferase [Bacteroidales bacterium]|jgi:ribosomal protein S18 acetylase RimI-like enzyme|nr:GNAT family N-acetyltransferase [Bacteroidales bacterium]